MARTRWPSDPVKPWPLIQARQIRPAAPVGATKAWDPADRSIRRTDPNGVSRLGGQAGTQAPDPTPPPSQSQGSRAGSTTHTLPADYLRTRAEPILRPWACRSSSSERARLVLAMVTGCSKPWPIRRGGPCWTGSANAAARPWGSYASRLRWRGSQRPSIWACWRPRTSSPRLVGTGRSCTTSTPSRYGPSWNAGSASSNDSACAR